MTTGELWVEHPIYPWLIVILAIWVGVSTIAQIRNWMHIRRLEHHNRLLQSLVTEGVGNVARQLNSIKEKFDRSRKNSRCKRRKKSRTEQVCAKGDRVRSKMEEPAAAEEIRENGAESGSPEETKLAISR
ncbi:MAG: hypothetical protein ACXAC5_02570 [Promethearchaeota archaeon]|jgi:hypothetical protein